MSDRCYVSTRKGLFTVDRGASKWSISRATFVGDNVTLTMHDPRNGNLLAALNHGHFGIKLHRSTDRAPKRGTKFLLRNIRRCRKGIRQSPFHFSSKPLDWALKLIWGMAPGGADQPGVVWCGTMPGGLFKSENNGESWELNRPLWDHPKREEWGPNGAEWPGIHSICVDPRDSQHVSIGVSTGGVWITRDGGKSWDPGGRGMRAEYAPEEQQYEPNGQDVHCLVQCAANPEVYLGAASQWHLPIDRRRRVVDRDQRREAVRLWICCRGTSARSRTPRGLFLHRKTKSDVRSTAASWSIERRTEARPFETLRRGLPQEYAYDLVYRHGLDVDETGNRLVFGSTTGSLWISEDGGESWQTVSSNLPPIYAVRFAKS